MVAWNSLYCIAHNLELAFFDGLREEHLPFFFLKRICFNPFISIITSQCPKALSELKELAEAMEEKNKKPGNLKGTRWDTMFALSPQGFS